MAEGASDQPNRSSHQSCSICLDEFKVPKLLSCFHTFCKDCLSNYIYQHMNDEGQFKCPLCRSDILVPAGGVDGFQTNFYIETERVMPELSIEADYPCDICTDGKFAVAYCLNCEENFCRSCVSSHMKMKVSRNHSLVSIGDPDVSGRITKRNFCSKHKTEEIRFVCEVCDEFICINCKLTSHENHSAKDINDVADGARKDIESALKDSRIGERKKQLALERESLSAQATRLKNESDTCCFEIMKKGISLKNKVDEEVKKMITKIKDYVHSTEPILTSEIKQIDCKIEGLASLEITAQQILEMACDVEAIEQAKELKQRLKTESEAIEEQEEANKKKKQEICVSFLAGSKELPVEDIIGTVIAGTSKQVSFAECTHMSTISAKGRGIVYSIACVGDNKAWISLYDSKNITLVNSKGKTLDSIDIGDGVDDMAYDDQGYLYITCPKARCIKRLRLETRTMEKIASTSRYPRGIVYNKLTKKILVTVTNKPAYSGQESDCELELVEVSVDSLKVKTHKIPSVTVNYPLRIALSITGYILIVNMKRNSVIVLNSDREFKSLYKGNAIAGNFKPHGVCVDEDGYIFVTTEDGKTVHVLNQDGKYIRHHPFSGAVYAIGAESGYLWLAIGGGKVEVWKYK